MWVVWIGSTAALVAFMGTKLMSDEADKTVFLPGETTSGHYQIELACPACHTDAFTDKDAMQEACETCHAEALKLAKDKHPKSKFTDPRNADRLAVLDARYCVTCHVEHRPDITSAMGLTLPVDYCFLCHQDIAEDRPSHEGMAFDTCASAGCHNFHDNRALYEDFLAKHLEDEDTTPGSLTRPANLREIVNQLPDYPLDRFPIEALEVGDADAPNDVEYDESIDREWGESSHADAGVTCSACHLERTGAVDDGDAVWTDQPDHRHCVSCHAGEVRGFLSGRHGMRLDEERLGERLSPMTPAMARLPMRAEAASHELGCTSCHGAHAFDSSSAVVESCLACHADEHSLAYEGTLHHDLWVREMSGELPVGSGVTCATCHLPRIERDYFWGTFTHNQVEHNQSDTMRPNEKMIRSVCMQCHGLGYTLDALADVDLIAGNFDRSPGTHVQSMDLARKRLQPDPRN